MIFGKSIEHNANLILLLDRLKQVGLKLQPDKCDYLKPNPAKMKAVKEFRTPVNITGNETQSFLGLTGYYRKFIKNFSHIAKALTDLTKKDNPFKWTSKHHEGFEKLKEILCTAPRLWCPDYKKDFTLTTDASKVELESVLSLDGHPCCFISITLNGAEQNYSTSEKELLAIVWATQRLK